VALSCRAAYGGRCCDLRSGRTGRARTLDSWLGNDVPPTLGFQPVVFGALLAHTVNAGRRSGTSTSPCQSRLSAPGCAPSVTYIELNTQDFQRKNQSLVIMPGCIGLSDWIGSIRSVSMTRRNRMDSQNKCRLSAKQYLHSMGTSVDSNKLEGRDGPCHSPRCRVQCTVASLPVFKNS
jgi:hypothetical protein